MYTWQHATLKITCQSRRASLFLHEVAVSARNILFSRNFTKCVLWVFFYGFSACLRANCATRLYRLLYAHAQGKNCKNFVFNIFFCSLAVHWLPLYPSSLALSTNVDKKNDPLCKLELMGLYTIYIIIYIFIKVKLSQNPHPRMARRGAKWVRNFVDFCRKGH